MSLPIENQPLPPVPEQEKSDVLGNVADSLEIGGMLVDAGGVIVQAGSLALEAGATTIEVVATGVEVVGSILGGLADGL